MLTMDLTTFYQHALQWRRQKEEAERLAAAERAENVKAEWKMIADLIREALPIQGMTIHETIQGEFDELPRAGVIYALDCQIDPARREQMRFSEEYRGDMRGVIRVKVLTDPADENPRWKIIGYEVWVNGSCTLFRQPEPSFLAAFEGLQG